MSTTLPPDTTKRIRVLLLSRYDTAGASSRTRSYAYIPFFEPYGIDVVRKPLFSDLYVERKHKGEKMPYAQIVWRYIARFFLLIGAWRYDSIWIEKELFPWLPATAERGLALLGMKYVVDYDDALFHTYDLHPNLLVRFFLGRKIDRVMKYAQTVIAGNEYLADRARRAGARRVVVIPSTVDAREYQSAQKPKASSLFRIGWLGSPTTVRHLETATGMLKKLCSKYAMQLVVLGAEKQTIRDMPVEYLAWSQDSETNVVKTFDVGIMPLPDDPWERGKCGHKLIKYMACGLPVVASPVGVNSEIVEHGTNGFLASTEKQWQTALLTLYNDPALRLRMGRQGFEKVHERYTVQRNVPRLAEVFRSASLGNELENHG
ncbi:MAG: glycosyltransferase family 4 protein [Candidatus Paceibacterota bacterium]